MKPCLGLTWLGMCSYDPSTPVSYFTLGDAVAAVAVTLALQSFMKPVFRFRLAAMYLSLGRLYALIFVGVLMTIVAALVPNLPFLGEGIWRYAILWEILATAFFMFAYGAVAFTILRPIRVRPKQTERFAQAVANILAQASETDHIDLIPDIEQSLPILVRASRFVEFKRPEFSAFELFTYRRQIAQGHYASSILRILSDPHFCQSLIRRAPWSAARLVGKFSADSLVCRSAEPLIQEIARQAIILDEGIMSREVSYSGFRSAPVLSEALFSDPFILRHYDPLDFWIMSEEISASVLRRFNAAAERCFDTMIGSGYVEYFQAARSIESFYQSASIQAGSLQGTGNVDFKYVMELNNAVDNSINLANSMLSTMDANRYNGCFANVGQRRSFGDPLESLVEIVFDIIQHISNSFEGSSDRFWTLAIGFVHKVYPPFGDQPDGLTPFQQRLTIKIVKKIQDNMDGHYPSICRVLLATVGPYERKGLQENNTAFNILRNAMYFELKRFPKLPPEKQADYLPSNVVFDDATDTLTHSFFGGTQRSTALASIKPKKVDLYDPKLRRPLTDDESKDAERQHQ